MSQFDLTGKTALVTGGGSGMGKEFARILAEAGATVMIAARNEERLKQRAAEIAADTGTRVHCQTVDLEDREDAAELVRKARQVMGGPDILVCNAATDVHASAETFNDDDYDRLFAVNLASNVWMTREAIPEMKKKQWGRIIYISSIAGRMGFMSLKYAIYSSTKAALEAYARNVAVELASSGITVNCLLPGGVRTEMQEESFAAMGMTAEQAEASIAYVSSLIPASRFAKPDEMAGTLLLLASNAGSYITGATYVVDGGWSIFGDTNI